MTNEPIYSGLLWSENETAFVRVVFRIAGDQVSPGIISNELNVEPSRAFAKDEPYLSKTHDLETDEIVTVWRPRYSGIWQIDTQFVESLKEVLDVNQHISFLLDLLEPHKEFIKKIMDDSENYRVDFVIEWLPFSNYAGCSRTFMLNSDMMIRMASLSLNTRIKVIIPEPIKGDDGENE